MAEMFDGAGFLAEKECKLKFSNGLEVVLVDIMDEGMEKLSALEKIESPTVSDIRSALAAMVNKEAGDFDGIGLRELNGAIGFLSERLFA